MKKIFVTFVNYNSDYNIQEDKEKYSLFKQYNSDRNKFYCEKHGIEYFEVDESVYKIPHLFSIPSMPEFTVKNNNHFARWQFFKDKIDSGYLQEGDIIYHHDADIFIVQTDKVMPSNKTFTYAIDTANSHCFGAFALVVNDFSKKLIDLMLSRERFEKLQHVKFYKENDGGDVFFYWGDQQAYYIAAGIKSHSWEPFYQLPNNGFYTYATEHIAFTLDELLTNVEILPVEWNVTHIVEEQGQSPYWINPSERKNTIFRHFAGGQRWNFEQYSREYAYKNV